MFLSRVYFYELKINFIINKGLSYQLKPAIFKDRGSVNAEYYTLSQRFVNKNNFSFSR